MSNEQEPPSGGPANQPPNDPTEGKPPHRQSFRVNSNGHSTKPNDQSSNGHADSSGDQTNNDTGAKKPDGFSAAEPLTPITTTEANIPKIVKGRRPGDRYVQIVRNNTNIQRFAPPRVVQLTEEDMGSGSGLWKRFKRLLIGRPIATAHSGHERLNKLKALAVFASDALSSVAYATEATMFVLVTAMTSTQPLTYVIPISIVICILIALVVNSYRQTVHAYPGGGGSYIVSKDNLGTNAGLIAAAAILIDYTLTVAVSVSAGVAAVTSAIPALNPYQVPIGVSLIVLIMVANLRGLRESGTIFAIPTYAFIIGFLGMLAYGAVKVLTGNYTPIPGIPETTKSIAEFNTQPITIFLLLQAFAAGCSALTGVEAISDGVQAFKKPESRNAAITLVAMGGLLITFFLGTSFLAYKLNAQPDNPSDPNYETVISEIGRNLFGNSSPIYFYIQATTALILVLAANTAFADFPRLSFFLARDKFLPNIFSFRGDRLAYTAGIVVLTVLASGLLIIFQGHTDALIPLYAVGVFLAFTLSQTGMVVHWQRKKKEGMRGVTRNQVFNAMGAVATGIVLMIIVVTKFIFGAWLVVILIPLIFLMFKGIHRHYTQVSSQLQTPPHQKAAEIVRDLPINGERSRTIVVPISRINKVSLSTLDFARSLSDTDNVRALFISDEPEAIEEMEREWQEYEINVPLVVIENPYRSIVPPLLNYIDSVERTDPNDILMVVLPEFVARHWWEHLLHNQTALRIKSTLLFRTGVVVVDVPYHMKRSELGLVKGEDSN